MPICNIAAMNHHLREISRQVAADAQAVMILDRAGWHRSQALVANSVFSTLADIVDACEIAWNRFATSHPLIRSLCAVAWAPASPDL
jgi:hypothetical protein